MATVCRNRLQPDLACNERHYCMKRGGGPLAASLNDWGRDAAVAHVLGRAISVTISLREGRSTTVCRKHETDCKVAVSAISPV